MEIKDIITQLEDMMDNYEINKSNDSFNDQDKQAIKAAIFQLKLLIPIKKEDDTIIKNFKEYAINNVGKKVYVEFDFSSVTCCGKESEYYKMLSDFAIEYPDGIFEITDETSIKPVDRDDMLLSTGFNLIGIVHKCEENAEDELKKILERVGVSVVFKHCKNQIYCIPDYSMKQTEQLCTIQLIQNIKQFAGWQIIII